MKDVTRRYTHSFLRSRQHCDEKWWRETVHRATLLSSQKYGIKNSHNNLPGISGVDLYAVSRIIRHLTLFKRILVRLFSYRDTFELTMHSVADIQERHEAVELKWKREEAELAERAASQQASTPKTISEFKTHTVYILKRHIKKYEVSIDDRCLVVVYIPWVHIPIWINGLIVF